MRIPTLFAILLLISVLIIGVTVFLQREDLLNKNKDLNAPFDIQVSNLTANSVTITWQTINPNLTKLSYGDGLVLYKDGFDDRNKEVLRHTHFVTLKELEPAKKYLLRIGDGLYSYPNNPLEFKTLGDDDGTLQSIVGTVLDGNLRPVDEAILVLDLGDAGKYSTYITTFGNFILPFSQTSPTTEAKLLISKGTVKSEVAIVLTSGKQTLPTLILGQNLDLRQFLLSVSLPQETLVPNPILNPQVIKTYDLNNDTKVNALDASIVLDNFGRNPKEKRADFNLDNTVDQKDLDLIKQALE